MHRTIRGAAMSVKLFDRVALIGIGLIGSSLARALRRDSPDTEIVACARRAETLAAVRRLAIASHLPHLIAYTIVGTATNLEESLKSEVIEFSASGFRDFTRIAASDPVMWRDIFLNNREAVLEIVQRFTEDLTALQRAIRWGEGDKLQELFTRTREIRRSIIEAKQA